MPSGSNGEHCGRLANARRERCDLLPALGHRPVSLTRLITQERSANALQIVNRLRVPCGFRMFTMSVRLFVT